MALTVDPAAERQPECFGMGDDSDAEPLEAGSQAGSDSEKELRVTPTGGFGNVCFAMGGDSDDEEEGSGSDSDSEYTSANSSDGDAYKEISGHHMDDDSSEDEAGGEDLEEIYTFNIDSLATALMNGCSPAELEEHVRGVLMNAGRPPKDASKKKSNETNEQDAEAKAKEEEEFIQTMVQIEETTQRVVKKAVRKSLGQSTPQQIQKARESAIKRHRQSLGLRVEAEEDEQAKFARAQEEAKKRRRKSLAKIITKTCEAAASGRNIDEAIKEAAEMARARHRKSVARKLAPPQSDAFEVPDDTLAKITKARNDAAENRRKSLVQKQQMQGSPEKPNGAPETEEVQDQVRRAMALAAERRRKSVAEKQKQLSSSQPSAAPAPAPTASTPETNNMEWAAPQSTSGPYTSPVNEWMPQQQQQQQHQSHSQHQGTEWIPQQQHQSESQQQATYQWQQGTDCQWQQANYQQPQQQQQQMQQGNDCQWQGANYQQSTQQQQQLQPGNDCQWQQGNYQQSQQQDAYGWQQTNCGYPQQYQQQDAYGNYQHQDAYGNYQQGGNCQQGMSQYGWQVQQEWQQNTDGSFYNTQTPSWQSSMTPEELRIQRTVADMCRPGMNYHGAYGHYGA
eukprot:gnl/MRDRNA2_/MRDRNA2_89543_c0_seq1.p1 gnl/MRDRNA2_/MRDRNA2_89543_c0~~gnl/MRDRNA2_/MRDRNA2_89543_c0_seq1.p1  ORF type:complete len:621 (-),score=175.64 gnl/MRDRNA2_/MRDRNA2_89543_c0_seq1:170-2032(-)